MKKYILLADVFFSASAGFTKQRCNDVSTTKGAKSERLKGEKPGVNTNLSHCNNEGSATNVGPEANFIPDRYVNDLAYNVAKTSWLRYHKKKAHAIYAYKGCKLVSASIIMPPIPI